MFVKSSEGLKSKFTLVALVASGKEIAYGMPLLLTSDEVHPLAGLLQRLGKLLALPDVHCILHGLDAKGVHIDCELHFDYNWPGASSQCRRTSPW